MKEIIYCICTKCGFRNTPDGEGQCIKGHDSWLEYRDVKFSHNLSDKELKTSKNEDLIPFKRAMRAFELSAEMLREKFMDKTITQIPVIKPIQL